MTKKHRLLVVEDEFLIALDMMDALEAKGFDIVGPISSVEAALQIIAASPHPFDGVILDVNLHGKLSFPIADLLMSMHVPFVFTTGYDNSVIPDRFDHILAIEKPVNGPVVAQMMRDTLEELQASKNSV
jgi:DNA-binding NtrC family response regulator